MEALKTSQVETKLITTMENNLALPRKSGYTHTSQPSHSP